MDMANTSTEGLEKYVEKVLCALDLEIEEESKKDQDSLHERTSRNQSQVLRNLVVTSCNIAPYGIVLIHFGNADKKSFKSHSISTGDKVVVTAMSTTQSALKSGITGCVEITKDKEISVAFDDIQPFESATNNLFELAKLVDDVTYNRMKNSVKRLLKFPSETESLTKLLFGSGKLEHVPLSPAILDSKNEVAFRNESLQPAQKKAIEFALKQKDFGIIHGPPGTGKTTTLVELIFLLVKSGEKVLVCAPSNVAIDNIMAKLHKYRLKSVRLGHPARVSEENRALTVNAYFDASFPAEALKDAKAELQNTINKLVLSKSSKKERAGYHALIRKLRSEIHLRETKMASEALLGVDVCFATLGSSYRENILRYFPQNFFSTLVIDEASQSLEAGCWMAVPYAKRCILAGDHHQLSPMILSQEAAQLGLSTTLMERAIHKLGSDSYLLLTHQFRMNDKIMDWVSKEMYGGQLTADSSVANHLLADIPGVEETDETSTPLLLVDTSGCSLREHCYHSSYGNSGEADLVAHMANLLIKAGVTQQSIAIITPYNRQVDLIKESLEFLSIGEIEVKTVDGFQGRECEAVILSLVRSNVRAELGFVSDRRRINVAVSRARRLICVVADDSTVGKDETIASLIKHIRQHGQAHSAHELREDVISTRSTVHEGDDQKVAPKKRKKNKNTEANDSDEPVTFKNFRENLQKFIDSDETMLVIESKLTGFQSLKIVAEIERLKLEYEVFGDRDQECIRVRKDPTIGSNDLLKPVSKSFKESKVVPKSLESEHFKTKLLQFSVSDEKVLRFPSNLNAAQRACIHEEAGKLNLLHASVGENKNRHIVVSKFSIEDQDDPECIKSGQKNLVTDDKHLTTMLHQFLCSEEKVLAFPTNLSTSQLAYVYQEVEALGLQCTTVGGSADLQIVVRKPRHNEQKELNEDKEIAETLRNLSLGCPAAKADPQVPSTQGSKKKKNKQSTLAVEVPANSSSKKKTTKQKALAAEVPAGDDSDNLLLEQLVKLSGQCSSANCKTGVRLIGHDCPHCKQRYCIPHALPEVHGCAIDAKKAARKEFVHPKPKALSDDKLKALHKSLKSKLAAKADMRSAAKK